MSPHAVDLDIRDRSPQKDNNDETYDLICIGFGPAALAIAIALHDARKAQEALPGLENIRDTPPKVLFLEKQDNFGWHTGMLLPGAKMQISFVKDLATMRDPQSHFTFLNYLHKKGRLAQFTNLDTFLPRRIEYADYMTWCASHFEDVVQYGQEVSKVTAVLQQESKITEWRVEARDVKTRTSQHFTARNIVLATGGKPQIPPPFPERHERVIHSSNYAHGIGKALQDRAAAYNIAVVGSGQSAAECFHNLQSRYPNSKTRLLIRGSALRPSDDSPFVNEIFDSDRTDEFYASSAETRASALAEDRNTNYGVVRGELLQDIYDDLYMQRLSQGDEQKWQHRILKHRRVVDVEASEDKVRLIAEHRLDRTEEDFDFDAVIVAAGYRRDMHEDVLDRVRSFTSSGKSFDVRRDYSVEMDTSKVSESAGIWLQGCNETTHGLGDTLLSLLATRGGEVVTSIFGDERYSGSLSSKQKGK